jgi:hypothetical protein
MMWMDVMLSRMKYGWNLYSTRVVGVALLKRGKKAKLKYPKQVVVGKTLYNQKYIVFPWEKE